MFTGIIQQLGTVHSLSDGVLIVHNVTDDGDPWQIGESIAVNGCCLTYTPYERGLRFDLSEETLSRTALHTLFVGSKVNIERAMRPMDRFGGHIVQGHVDTVGKLVRIDGERLTFQVEGADDRYLIDKGSICIDGISLTIVRPESGRFSIAVIPHTLAVTNLGDKQEGDPVNIEFDVIAKHVEKLLAYR